MNLTTALADPVEEKALHMVNADSNRTPTFTMFANPDFFFQTSDPCTGFHECVWPAFAWNHGDIQTEIGNTWVGMVGPGIAGSGNHGHDNGTRKDAARDDGGPQGNHGSRNIDSTTWTDHTNLRPTILALVGLKDDYLTTATCSSRPWMPEPCRSWLSGKKVADLRRPTSS